MTAQSSTRNRLLTYYLYRLGKLKFLMILLCLFAFLTFPLYSFFLEGYASETLSATDIGTTFHVICDDLGWKIFAAGTAGGLIVMLIIGLESFRYLHNKKYVNMDMSLPVTHTQRFFGDLLAMLTAQFVPTLAACGTGAVITAHVRSIDYSYFYPNGGTPSYFRTCATLEDMIPLFIISAAMLIAMSLFVISFCGRTPVAVIMTIVVQIAVPLSTFCLWIIGLSGAYGAVSSGIMDQSLMALLSPLGYLFASGSGGSYRLLNNSPLGYIFVATYIAALIIGSYFVQKHRRVERTGEPFVYKYARHTFTALFILAITALYAMRLFASAFARDTVFYYWFGSDNSQSAMTIYTIICIVAIIAVFIIMELIGGGKLKKAPAAAARFVVTTGTCFGLCALMPFTGCFGVASYIPSADEADSAWITFMNNGDHTGTFTVPYEEAAALHRRIIEERPGSATYPYYNSGTYVRITYLNNTEYGFSQIAERAYEVTSDYVRDIYNMYLRNGGLANQYLVRYNGGAHTYTFRNEYGQYVDVEQKVESFVFLWADGVRPVIGKNEEDYMIKSDINVEELMDTLIEEANAVTFEQYYLSPYRPPQHINIRWIFHEPTLDTASAGAVSSNYDEYVTIYPFFTKTVAMLKKHGIDLFPDEQPDYSEYSVFLIKAPQTDVSSVESIYTMTSNNNDIVGDPGSTAMHRVDAGSDELKELMSYTAEKTYYEGGERYYIWMAEGHYGDAISNTLMYPITEENTARAAEIWESLPIAQKELDNLRDHGNIFSIEEVEEYDARIAAELRENTI